MDLNKVMVIGNLTRDPEMRNVPSGDSVANFGVATNRIWTDQAGQRQEAVEYHNVVAWRKLADICGQYLKKGNKVYIEGRLQTRDWEGQDGIKRYRTEIVARDLIMLGSPPGGRPPEAMAESRKNLGPTTAPIQPAQTPTAEAILKTQGPPEEIPTINVEPVDTKAETKPEEDKKKPAPASSGEQTENEGISIEDIPF